MPDMMKGMFDELFGELDAGKMIVEVVSYRDKPADAFTGWDDFMRPMREEFAMSSAKGIGGLIQASLWTIVRAAVSRHIDGLPRYPTVRAERGEYHDVVLVWSEEVPVHFKFMVSQAAYAKFIGHKLTEELLGTMASYVNGMIVRAVDREDIWRHGLEWGGEIKDVFDETPVIDLMLGRFTDTRVLG